MLSGAADSSQSTQLPPSIHPHHIPCSPQSIERKWDTLERDIFGTPSRRALRATNEEDEEDEELEEFIRAADRSSPGLDDDELAAVKDEPRSPALVRTSRRCPVGARDTEGVVTSPRTRYYRLLEKQMLIQDQLERDKQRARLWIKTLEVHLKLAATMRKDLREELARAESSRDEAKVENGQLRAQNAELAKQLKHAERVMRDIRGLANVDIGGSVD